MRDVLVQVRTLLGDCADVPAWGLSDAEIVEALGVAHAVEQVAAAVKLHLIRQVDGRDLATTRHATSTSAWLREFLRIGASSAKRLVDLAGALDRRPGLDAALADAAVNVEQVQVIAGVLGDLPVEVGPEVVAKAEAELIGFAGQFDPKPLGVLGSQILGHVAPEVAEEAEAKALERAERRARVTRSFMMTPTGDGRTRVTGWLDAEAAATVNAALDPLCAPSQGPVGDERTAAQRRADALTDVCRLALNTGELPANGGDRPQVVVTIPFDALRDQLGSGILDTGETLSATEVRRMACDAQLIPAILGGEGQVLDLGRSRRLFTGPIRRALVLRDGGCAFPGCDRPARWCEAHHRIPWTSGGKTDLDSGVLLCTRHHGVIHRGEWTVRLGADRRPEFIPPAHIDPDRRPRRNLHHRRP